MMHSGGKIKTKSPFISFVFSDFHSESIMVVVHPLGDEVFNSEAVSEPTIPFFCIMSLRQLLR